METAKEFLEENAIISLDGIVNAEKLLIEFAKMHVQEALKQASEKARTPYDSDGDAILDKNSILTAYPLENIK